MGWDLNTNCKLFLEQAISRLSALAYPFSITESECSSLLYAWKKQTALA